MDVDEIAEAIAGDSTCAQGEFWQRKMAVVAHLMGTGHELAASMCEAARLRELVEEVIDARRFPNPIGALEDTGWFVRASNQQRLMNSEEGK